MNVNSIKFNNVYHDGEVDLDALLPEAVEGLDVIKGLDENKEVLGAKNLLPLTLEKLKAINTEGTWSGNAYTRNGVTFTVNTDSLGSITDITVNGTASATTEFYVVPKIENLFYNKKISGAFNGTSTALKLLFNYLNSSGGFISQFAIYNNSEGIITQNTAKCNVSIYVANGITANNVIFYPMIRLATDPNPTYRPYAMSNQELTQRLLSLEQRVAALEG